MPDFLWAAGILYLVVSAGSWALSRMGTVLVKASRQVFGRRLTLLLIDSPSILLHELCHLAVAIVFGHRVTEVNLKGVFIPGAASHVSTLYNPRNVFHRLGLSMMALAPIVLPMLALVMVVVDAYGFPERGRAGEWVRSLITGTPEASDLPLLLGILYLHLLISATMRLSRQDWFEFARGSLSWVALLVLVAALFYRSGPPWFWGPTVLIASSFAIAMVTKAIVLAILLPAVLVRRMIAGNPVGT